MNQNTEEYLQQVIKEDNIQNSLYEVRTKIEEQLFREHVLSCLFMVEEFHPLLSSISEKYPNFDFSISQSYDGEFINLNSSVEVLDEDDVSDFVEEINEGLKTFVYEQFSESQIRKFFPSEDIYIKFNNNYSKDNFSNFIIKSLVNEEVMTFLLATKLDNNLPNNSSNSIKKSKI